MTEQKPGEEIQTFVHVGQDGPDRIHHFAPWPTDEQGQPQVRVMMIEVPADQETPTGGGAPLRHLSYDDPPGIGTTPDEYRTVLASAVQHSDSEAEFTQMLVMALARDLVMAHGVHPHVAVPAVMDFARKVYAEFSSI